MTPIALPWDLRLQVDGTSFAERAAENDEANATAIPATASIVTTLPAAAVAKDGMEIYYVADATFGIVWKFRYRAASASASKWEFVGGPPLFGEIPTNENINSATYVALATAGPSLTLPFAGDYDVAIGFRPTVPVVPQIQIFMSYDIGGTGAVDADGAQMFADQGRDWGSLMRPRRKAGLAAVTLVAKYRENVATLTQIADRWMSVTPVRVGP